MNVLIVRGGWPGHEPVATTDLFLEFLASHGLTARIAETLEVYENRAAPGASS